MPASSSSPSPVVVAIDGPAGSGKSTLGKALAKALAHALGHAWAYLDTGAMYRAVAVEALRRGVPLEDASTIAGLCLLYTSPSPRDS